MKRWLVWIGSVAFVAGFVAILLVGLMWPFRSHDSQTRRSDTTVAKQLSGNTGRLPLTSENLLKLVNEERAKAGVAPLQIDSRLSQSAQRKADDEVKYGYFGHVSPNDGKHGYEYITDTGIYCKTDSENLVNNIDPATSKPMDNNATGAVEAWIASKPHHAAMLDQRYTLTGFGISGTQVVEHFCEQ